MKLGQLEISGVELLSAYRIALERFGTAKGIFHFDAITTTLIETNINVYRPKH